MYRRLLSALVIVSFLTAPAVSLAQSSAQIDARQAQLQADYDQAMKELQALNAQAAEIKGQKASLERDIALINAEIKQAEAKIRVRTLAIAQLTKDIGTKETTISDLEARLDRSAASLADIVRRTNVNDSVSLPSILLGNKDFSDFFVQVDSLGTVSKSLDSLMGDMKNYKAETEEEKADLEGRKAQEQNAKAEIEAARREIERKKAEKNKILAETKGQEAAYTKLIANKEQKIAQISAALFPLRDSEGIQFGTALQYANIASQATGVRPAFILAILTQESSLGKNLGACYLRDYDTGDGVGVNTGSAKPRTMSPTRDVPPFLRITRELGINPQSQRVSCWIAMYSGGKPAGWGGAMGPAQFIPSTWDLFDERIEKALGVAVANPWMAEHAILASALYLSDLGAGLQTYSAEKDAACRYYSGKKCSAGTGNSYGVSVMQKAANIQECMIDPILGKGSGC